MSKPKTMSHPLTRYREAHKLTITDMAVQLGVSKATVSRWEAGLRTPSPEHLPVIARLTGSSIPALMGLEAA